MPGTKGQRDNDRNAGGDFAGGRESYLQRRKAKQLELEAIIKALHLKILAGNERLTTCVKGGYTGDLLSDVMANSSEGDLWITRQTHQNIIAVASLKEHAGIVLTGGSEPAPETVARAQQENIPLLVSDRFSFALSGELYMLITKKEGKPSPGDE